jgi:AAA domain, putative AbiEii toxin, Type IV TA system
MLLRQTWNEWVRNDTAQAEIELVLGEPIVHAKLVVHRIDESTDELTATTDRPPLEAVDAPRSLRNLWGPGAAGSSVTPGSWFCASYGPFRRFIGGDEGLQKLYTSNPRLARHLSMFGEATALSEALPWIESLRFKQLEGSGEGELLGPIVAFINQPGFLPHGVQLRDVSSRGVELVDASGSRVPIHSLSDGYRSVLSMTLELIRQLAMTYHRAELFSSDGTQVIGPGVVIVDEIDAHLHPSWQRTLGVWFLKHFPNIQFIVSTHSPLVCQATETGSVFRLPAPGADPEVDRGVMVNGLARNRLLYGSVLDAYGTGVFGEGVERSDSGHAKLERLAQLNTRELTGALSEDERRDQSELRAVLATDASIHAADDPAA